MKLDRLNEQLKIERVSHLVNNEEVAKLLYQTASKGFKNGSPWEESHFFHSLEAKNSVVITASIPKIEDRGQTNQIVGLLVASLVSTEAEIYLVVVDEAFKKRRIAFRMFEHLISYCKENKITSIFLEVRVSNEPAIGLYQALGFLRVGVRKAYYSSPIEDAIVMELKLQLNEE